MNIILKPKSNHLLFVVSLFFSIILFSCDPADSSSSSSSEDKKGSVTSVTVTPKTATVTTVSTFTLTATVVVTDGADQTVTWSSSDTTKATVDNAGVVTGVAAGTVTITATSTVDNSKTDTATITVTAPFFTLSSSKTDDGFNNGDYIDRSFLEDHSVSSHGVFPKISWANAPTGTTYFVLIFQRDDQTDASAFQRQGHGIWVIDKNVTSLPKTAAQSRARGAKIITTAGVTGLEYFIAPNVHTGTSRFKLYAVDYTSLAAITNALLGDLNNDGTVDAGKKPLYIKDPTKNGHNGGNTSGLETANRITTLESYLSGHILASSEITYKSFYNLVLEAGAPGVKNTATSGTNTVNDFVDVVSSTGVLKQEYGYDYKNSKGELDFPVVSILGSKTNGTVTRFLIFQDEDSKNWGHGIWIVNPDQTSFGKAEGNPTKNGGGQITGGHASISSKTGVISVIEPYYAPTPPPTSFAGDGSVSVVTPHSYKFYIFDTNMSQADLTTELNKIKEGGSGTSAHADRVAKIKELLGDKILQEASFGFDYPTKKTGS